MIFKPSGPEADGTVGRDPYAFLVRAAVDERVAHANEQLRLERAARVHDCDEAAHQAAPSAESFKSLSTALRALPSHPQGGSSCRRCFNRAERTGQVGS